MRHIAEGVAFFLFAFVLVVILNRYAPGTPWYMQVALWVLLATAMDASFERKEVDDDECADASGRDE